MSERGDVVVAQIESFSLEDARRLGTELDKRGYKWCSNRRFFESESWNSHEHQFFYIGLRGDKMISRSGRTISKEKFDFDGNVNQFLEFIGAINDDFEIADENELIGLLA